MRNFFVFFLLVPVIFATGCPTTPKADSELLPGRWLLTHETYQGKEMPPEKEKTFLTFDKDGGWKVEAGGELMGGGMYTIDHTKNPKTIDYLVTKGDDAGKTFFAIYEVTEKAFKHCGQRTGGRPEKFESPAGSEIYLTSFKREDHNK